MERISVYRAENQLEKKLTRKHYLLIGTAAVVFGPFYQMLPFLLFGGAGGSPPPIQSRETPTYIDLTYQQQNSLNYEER